MESTRLIINKFVLLAHNIDYIPQYWLHNY